MTDQNAFTAHNIRFADGTETMPGFAGGLLADTAWCQGAKRVLNLLYRGAYAGKRIADLGCLEGGYALEFARLGMSAFGLEVRQSNYDNCLEVQRRAGLPNLAFAKDDVWNLPQYGTFDVIFCCGLLYHLDRPREFIHLMGRQARDAIIINTHYGQPDHHPETVFEKVLGPIETHEGYPGRWYFEHNGGTVEQLEKMKWASWDNRQSFWPIKEGLLEAMREAGFDLAFEQYDTLGNILENGTSAETVRHHRGVFVGIRTASLGRWRKRPTWLARLLGV